MNGRSKWVRRFLVCLLLGGLLGPNAYAARSPYLVIGDGRLAYVYRWLLPDGTVLKQGMTDDQGRASLVERAGKLRYVLETQWGAYAVRVPAKCWKMDPHKFSECVTISQREDTSRQKQQAEADRKAEKDRQELQARRVAWVENTIPAAQQAKLIEATLREHQSWLTTSAAKFPDKDFHCRALSLPAPSGSATAWFDKGESLPEGMEQDLAYVKAAELGHWRAAARLASSALDNEDWESAQPVITWMLKNSVPSGYAKLAQLIESTATYDGATTSTSVADLAISLRWRAAQLGDPVAQAQMSRYFSRVGNDQLAVDLMSCARQQNPGIR